MSMNCPRVGESSSRSVPYRNVSRQILKMRKPALSGLSNGGRYRDRTYDLSRVKGTLSQKGQSFQVSIGLICPRFPWFVHPFHGLFLGTGRRENAATACLRWSCAWWPYVRRTTSSVV